MRAARGMGRDVDGLAVLCLELGHKGAAEVVGVARWRDVVASGDMGVGVVWVEGNAAVAGIVGRVGVARRWDLVEWDFAKQGFAMGDFVRREFVKRGFVGRDFVVAGVVGSVVGGAEAQGGGRV